MKLAGVIVLYNPNISEILDNIRSYIGGVDTLFVFDNSESNFDYEKELCEYSNKISYFSFRENMGIAFALNYTCKLATDLGYDWILTMDQDSSFLMPSDFKDYINHLHPKIDTNIALFSPSFFGEISKLPQFYTSGSLVNLKAWYSIGKFDENLFIDEVDGDFTYRLKEANYSLIKIHDLNLVHALGSKYCMKILGKKICSDNHSALRKYYIARNRVYLMKNRPNMRKVYLSDSFRKLVLMFLIEKDKVVKLKLIIRGIYHGLANKMGKFQ